MDPGCTESNKYWFGPVCPSTILSSCMVHSNEFLKTNSILTFVIVKTYALDEVFQFVCMHAILKYKESMKEYYKWNYI